MNILKITIAQISLLIAKVNMMFKMVSNVYTWNEILTGKGTDIKARTGVMGTLINEYAFLHHLTETVYIADILYINIYRE